MVAAGWDDAPNQKIQKYRKLKNNFPKQKFPEKVARNVQAVAEAPQQASIVDKVAEKKVATGTLKVAIEEVARDYLWIPSIPLYFLPMPKALHCRIDGHFSRQDCCVQLWVIFS